MGKERNAPQSSFAITHRTRNGELELAVGFEGSLSRLVVGIVFKRPKLAADGLFAPKVRRSAEST